MDATVQMFSPEHLHSCICFCSLFSVFLQSSLTDPEQDGEPLSVCERAVKQRGMMNKQH